jgi:hypothetical protein
MAAAKNKRKEAYYELREERAEKQTLSNLFLYFYIYGICIHNTYFFNISMGPVGYGVTIH